MKKVFAALFLSVWACSAGASGVLPAELAALPYPQGEVLALQICLDRRGFSPNTLDGQYGRKTQVALATYCAWKGLAPPDHRQAGALRKRYFPNETNLLATLVVTPEDLASCVRLPPSPAEKAALPAMGYETLQELFAERGHLTQHALKRLNPHASWPNPPAGTCLVLPDFSGPFPLREEPSAPAVHAGSLRISRARFEITVFDTEGRLLALFPCSIAADRAKLPPAGELYVKSVIPNPNYTYTPDEGARGKKTARWIFPPGPNNPVGVAWVGLTLKGYGIHGSPFPERIGRAESHGCFRLSNWNAARLMKLCDTGVPVVVE